MHGTVPIACVALLFMEGKCKLHVIILTDKKYAEHGVNYLGKYGGNSVTGKVKQWSSILKVKTSSSQTPPISWNVEDFGSCDK